MRRPAAAAVLALCLAGCGGAEAPPAASGPGGPTSSAAGSAAQGDPSPPAGPEQAAEVPGPGGAAAAPEVTVRPTRIVVRRIGVDVSVGRLGIEADGALEVPTDYARAGWLDRSSVPGRRGPAVIAGHVDSRSGPAAFYRLSELRAGDRITVTNSDGSRASFTVEGVARYPKSRFPSAAVYGPVPGPVLRLITCGGSFDRASGHYRDNVVVYAS